MVNKNLLNTARELGKDLLKTVEHTEKKRTIKLKEETPKKVHTLPRQKPFTLEYLGGFTDELIKKTNERFKGSRINMPYKENGLVNQIGILDRLAMITTIYSDNHLQSAGLYPLSPLQSELLLKDGKIPNKSLKNDEYLALILYFEIDNTATLTFSNFDSQPTAYSHSKQLCELTEIGEDYVLTLEPGTYNLVII